MALTTIHAVVVSTQPTAATKCCRSQQAGPVGQSSRNARCSSPLDPSAGAAQQLGDCHVRHTHSKPGGTVHTTDKRTSGAGRQNCIAGASTTLVLSCGRTCWFWSCTLLTLDHLQRHSHKRSAQHRMHLQSLACTMACRHVPLLGVAQTEMCSCLQSRECACSSACRHTL
jgi:hypothetical protein